MPTVVEKDLDELAADICAAASRIARPRMYLEKRHPGQVADQLKVDEKLLVQSDGMTPADNERHKLLYVGRRTIGRLGFSRLPRHPGLRGCEADRHGFGGLGPQGAVEAGLRAGRAVHRARELRAWPGSYSQHRAGPDPHNVDPDTGFFLETVVNHEREGFIWQKLREPRSYDYRMTENKDYIERLRMPKFNLSDEQREAVITFVLGLVAEPPAAQYVYKADPRRKAMSTASD